MGSSLVMITIIPILSILIETAYSDPRCTELGCEDHRCCLYHNETACSRIPDQSPCLGEDGAPVPGMQCYVGHCTCYDPNTPDSCSPVFGTPSKMACCDKNTCHRMNNGIMCSYTNSIGKAYQGKCQNGNCEGSEAICDVKHKDNPCYIDCKWANTGTICRTNPPKICDALRNCVPADSDVVFPSGAPSLTIPMIFTHVMSVILCCIVML